MSGSSHTYFLPDFVNKIINHIHKLRLFSICIFLLLTPNPSQAVLTSFQFVEREAANTNPYIYLEHISDFITDNNIYKPHTLKNLTAYPKLQISFALDTTDDEIDHVNYHTDFNISSPDPIQETTTQETSEQLYHNTPSGDYKPAPARYSIIQTSETYEPKTWILTMLAIGVFAVFRLRYATSINSL